MLQLFFVNFKTQVRPTTTIKILLIMKPGVKKEVKVVNKPNFKTNPIIELQNNLLKAKTIEEVYRLIPAAIREIIGSGIVITSMLNKKIQAMSIVAYAGVNNTLNKIINLLGADPRKSVYYLKDMTLEEIKLFRSGRLERLDGGLYALSTRKFPKKICTAVETTLGITDVYTMGCIYNSMHFGGLIILTNQDINPYRETIEEIINQASILIQRIAVENDLQVAKERAEESDRLKTAFLQNVSHEIRTPMNSIIGFSSLLKQPKLKDEKRINYASNVINSTNQLLSIVNDILTIASITSKQEKIELSEININRILSELSIVLAGNRTNKDVKLINKTGLSDEQATIICDKTKLSQILTHLISNALKFTSNGYVEYGCQLKNNFLEFYVKDTGIGIYEDKFEKIFNSFYQVDMEVNRTYGGTGLGLTICKEFVTYLGGEIWLESKIGKGSTFYFTIPYQQVLAAPNDQLEILRLNNALTILIAEDEELNFLYIKELLELDNCDILHAKNGSEAVDLFKSTPNIDIILMDIKMPVMEGHVAAKIIKEKKSEVPIIAQTAYALPSEIRKYGDIFDEYMTKPINDKLLIETINKFTKTNILTKN